MANRPADPSKRRNQQTNFMLTADEKMQLHQFADEMGMSISTACRYLIKKGLSVHHSTVNDERE